jgi:hypothetical protein
MTLLGERQVVVDCDVLQADGGTRTASICGGYLALHDALTRLKQSGAVTRHPLTSLCAAVSVGIVGGVPVIDLPYVEDSGAEVDMNIVMLRDKESHVVGSSRFKALPKAWPSLAANWIRFSALPRKVSLRSSNCRANCCRRNPCAVRVDPDERTNQRARLRVREPGQGA